MWLKKKVTNKPLIPLENKLLHWRHISSHICLLSCTQIQKVKAIVELHMEIQFLNHHIKIWTFQWSKLWETMRNSQLILSVSYAKRKALAEGCAEKHLTYGCPCNSGACGPSFDGRNSINTHCFSHLTNLWSKWKFEEQMDEIQENFPIREIFLIARKIWFLNHIF